MSFKRAKRAEDRILRGIDQSRETAGTNGIGKAFELRPRLDWRVLLAFQFHNGKRIGVTR